METLEPPAQGFSERSAFATAFDSYQIRLLSNRGLHCTVADSPEHANTPETLSDVGGREDMRRRTRPMVVFVNVASVERIIYAIFHRFNQQ